MKKMSPLASFVEWADVPPEAAFNLCRVEIVGQSQVRVENHRGLIQFGSAQVILARSQGHLVIDGQDLMVKWIDGKDLLIVGRIFGVSFEEGLR